MPVQYPIPPNAPIEGGASSSGDRHVLLVDRDACRLSEVYSAYPQSGGASWTAGSGAIWDLRSNALRPQGWTSADAAGLPILPGLVRYEEVAAGAINHVLRFTRRGRAMPTSGQRARGVDQQPVRAADGSVVPTQGELRHLRLLGSVPGDFGL